MICFAKPILTVNLYILQKEEFSATCYMCDTHTRRKPMHIHKRQTQSSRHRGCYIRTMTARVQLKEKSLVVSLQGLGPETNWLAVNHQSSNKFHFELLSQLTVPVVRNEKLVAEAGDSLGNPEEGERRSLEAVTKEQLVKTEDLMCAVVTVIFGVCTSVRLS
jgi:hypothetical protein